jgi:hypothetical protein
MSRINRRLVLAEHFGCDYADLSDARYQSSRFVKVPVYVGGNDYWCVTRGGELPPTAPDAGANAGSPMGWAWEALPADVWPLPRYSQQLTIWRARGSSSRRSGQHAPMVLARAVRRTSMSRSRVARAGDSGSSMQRSNARSHMRMAR